MPAQKIVETVIKPSNQRFESSQISFRNPNVVKSYLVDRPQIEDFIKLVWPSLVEYFGETISLVLEVMISPDEIDSDELVGWIQTTDDVNEALDKLEQFEDQWLEEQLNTVGCAFNFNIEMK